MVRGKARSSKEPPPTDNRLRFEFWNLAEEIHAELLSLEVPIGSRPAYWTLIVNCVKAAKEEQRLLEGIGAGVEYSITIKPPPLFSPSELEAAQEPKQIDEPRPEPAGETVH